MEVVARGVEKKREMVEGKGDLVCAGAGIARLTEIKYECYAVAHGFHSGLGQASNLLPKSRLVDYAELIGLGDTYRHLTCAGWIFGDLMRRYDDAVGWLVVDRGAHWDCDHRLYRAIYSVSRHYKKRSSTILLRPLVSCWEIVTQ